MTLVPAHHPPPVDVTPGDPAGCDCDDRDACRICGQTVCPVHQADALTPCADASWHHRDDCERVCVPCDIAALEDYQADMADEAWKERPR